jgi:hypothetical protein
MIVYLSLVFFMPKEQLIYTGLNSLSKELVNFEIEEMSDYGLYEDVKEVTVIYDKMRVAKVEKVKLLPFIVYNKLFITTLEPQGSFKNMLNLVVLNATASYSIIQPFKVSIDVQTTIGSMKGDFNLKNSKLKLLLSPNKNYKKFRYKNYFKKTKEGYVYESIIR